MSAKEPKSGSDANPVSLAERRVARVITLLAIAIYPVLLWRGWGCWNDVVVDYGRELYVPWRLTLGEVLYRDVAYFNGPLSPYWNAFWFLVGGVGLRTLTIVNAVLTAGFGWLLHRRTCKAGGPIAAGVTLLAFEFIFACGHFPGIGNYNFLSPYSHELTHGLLLGLGAFSCALRARAKGPTYWALCAGLLLGLCFLTKAEVFLASAGSIGWIFVLAWKSGEGGAPRRLAILAGATLVAPLVAWGLLAMAMPIGDALYGTLGSWTGIFGSSTSDLLFYKTYMGLDRTGENLGALFESAGLLLAVLAPAALIDRWQRNAPLRVRAVVAVAYAVALGLLFTRGERSPLDWILIARFLPLFALLACIAASLCALRGARSSRSAWGERAGFSVFALLMMLKMILIALLAHYGFALAVCGAALFVMVVLEWLPSRLGTGPSRGLVLRLAAITLIGVTTSAFWSMSERVFATKTIVIGSGADRFMAEPPRAQFVEQLRGEIEERLDPTQTVLVLPEGIMVNYLTRRRTPTRHINFMPPELELFGEETVLRELRRAQPAAIVLIHKDTSEYGMPLFGTDYGIKIMGWAKRRYKPDWLVGDPPLEPTTRFGIGLLGPR